MGPQFYKVSNIGNGFLAVMAKPATDDRIDDACADLAAAGISHVVSLLESAEALKIGLGEEQSACERNGMRFFSYPIPDRGLPSSLSEFAAFTWNRYCDITRGKTRSYIAVPVLGALAWLPPQY